MLYKRATKIRHKSSRPQTFELMACIYSAVKDFLSVSYEILKCCCLTSSMNVPIYLFPTLKRIAGQICRPWKIKYFSTNTGLLLTEYTFPNDCELVLSLIIYIYVVTLQDFVYSKNSDSTSSIRMGMLEWL